MDRLKILILPSWYPNESDPLWGNYFIKQAEALNEYADVTMFYVDRIGIREVGKLFKRRSTDGLDESKHSFKFYKKTVINYKSLNLDFSYNRYIKNGYKAYKKLEEIIGKPDVILVESALPAGLIAKYIKEKDGIPYVVHAHSEGIITNPIYEKYTESIIKDANSYMAVNNTIKSLVEKKRSDCQLVPNFINCSKFDVKNEKYPEFTLISISNFYKIKAIDVLLKAMDIVVNKKNQKDIKLKIVGTGEYKSFYESVARSLKLQDNVEFLGYVDNDLLPDVISKSHALCVSSTFETFCIPIVEALATGIPVITTDCVGPLEIVNNDNSIVTPINDIEKYADSIINMKNKYDKFDSKKIKKYAFNNYDKSIVCKKIIDTCSKVISH